MKEKLAIVMSGGGTACAYAVGVLKGLAEQYPTTKPEIVIGSSGSSGIAVYYTAGQQNYLENIWENYITRRSFINHFRFWKIADIDYLLEEVVKKDLLIDTKTYFNSTITCLIAATNYETGEPTYFSNRDHTYDISDVMRASAAVPILYGRYVTINGFQYGDSAISTSIALHCTKAKEYGATKIIAIDNGLSNPIIQLIYQLWLKRRTKEFVEAHNRWVQKIFDYQNSLGNEVFYLSPKETLPHSLVDNNKEVIESTINQGRNDVLTNTRLHSFLK